MKKAILIDGNNLIFRSYYATAYNGNLMKNSKGFPTNALFGFVNMMNKIIKEEKPVYIIVAFDKGKNFRHEKYKNYKDGRIETPKELLEQFPIAKQILTYMGIKYLEVDNYEADDIIGTFAKMADEDKLYDATIISSDKDLLQLISDEVDVKLLKQKGFIMMNEKTFKEEYGINPINIIDLKALEGDKSDNIPGVKGIGEKTALNLLKQYETIEDIYNDIDNIKGKVKDKLINDKENAFFSKELATIYKDIKLDITFEDIIKKAEDKDSLYNLYEELEFYSFIKRKQKEKKQEKLDYKIISNIDDLKLEDEYSLYIETNNSNYHNADIIGISITDKNNSYYINKELFIDNINIFNAKKIYTYDMKKNYCLLKRLNKTFNNITFDLMIAGYLLNYNMKDDIAYLSNIFGYDILFYENILKETNEKEIEKAIVKKSKFIFENINKFNEELKNEKLDKLFYDVEMPLLYVLGDMELDGIKVDCDVINNHKEEIEIKLEMLSKTIYNYAGMDFNINSPKQLGEVLFDKMHLPTKAKKKGKTSYSTSHDKLIKLVDLHPIIKCILEYRNLSKLKNTYLDTLTSYIKEDGKIHTIFKQNGARTGRLSSVEPNLQNIPIRTTEGSKIRKAFIPENDYILASDYSQIELRILADVTNSNELIDAFNSKTDIHTKVAADIFNVPEEAVTKHMRSSAKAVIFGIVYGISSWGLGENLSITAKEAKQYIEKYLSLYPDVKNYMEEIVKETKKTNVSRTLLNRKRVIEELTNENYMIRMQGERIAINTPIQGSSADLIKKAMVDVKKEFTKQKIKSKMIIQIHDELVFDVYKNELEKVKKIVKDKMENVYKLKVPIKVEIDYGKNWNEAK